MHIRQQTPKDPYTIVITKEEMKEAFRSPVSYELFRQTLLSQILMVHLKEKEEQKEIFDMCRMQMDPLKYEKEK